MDVTDIGYGMKLIPLGKKNDTWDDWNKDPLIKMIDKLGLEETTRRFAWLYSCSLEETGLAINQMLTGDYVDEKGIKGGNNFWGDL